MIKQLGWLAMAFLPFSVFAEMGSDAPSDACLRSLRDLYQFYYYEIQPNPKHNVNNADERLGPNETLKMQVVIGELKQNCPPEIIARVNDSLKDNTTASETAAS